MELRHYFRLIRKGWPVILAAMVLCTALGLGVTLASKKIYQANVQLFVALTPEASSQLAQGNTFVQDRVQSYLEFATAPAVTAPVISSLKLPLKQDKLAGMISADAPQNEVLINLHVQDTDPTRAATVANALAAQYAKYVVATEQTDSTGKPIVKLTVIHPATVPGAPIKPDKTINLGLGVLLGLLAGVVIVVLRDVMDNTVKGPRDFEDLNVPVLGHVPFDKRVAKTPIAFRGDPHGPRSEAYRQLRTNLQFIDVDNPPRVIAVTSALPGEGKTTTAINLAAALAEAGNRVCLVETDLRRPTLARSLGLVGDVGFTTVLIGKTPVESVLQNAGRNLAVLTSGPLPPNPSELLLSEQAKALIASIAEQVDFVILDTPPLLPVADGAEMAIVADATVLVHRAGKTTHDQVQRAVQVLAKVDRHPVGAILNMVTRSGARYGGYEYGYYYVDYAAQTPKVKKADKKGDKDRPSAKERRAAKRAAKRAQAPVPPMPETAVDDLPPAASAPEPVPAGTAPSEAALSAEESRRAQFASAFATSAPAPAGTATARAAEPPDRPSPAGDEWVITTLPRTIDETRPVGPVGIDEDALAGEVDDIGLVEQTHDPEAADQFARQATYPNGLRQPAGVDRSNGSAAVPEAVAAPHTVVGESSSGIQGSYAPQLDSDPTPRTGGDIDEPPARP
ncbi:MAG: tyrosine-protein kinase [Pseudonocardiales bacterium]|nr:tyrosine-protein kinase [Pseudonocardiales bacterium]